MASENVDWDQPLSSTAQNQADEDISELTYEEHRYRENMKKLINYVDFMSYSPIKPPTVNPHIEILAKPSKRYLLVNAKDYSKVMEPQERADRLTRLASKYTTITAEQLELIIKQKKTKDLQRETILKRKQKNYYTILNKMERQCRSQYLYALKNKFGNYISQIATSMHISPYLSDSYSRMQCGIFCNILLATGVQPTSQTANQYNAVNSEHEVFHKLSHAILSLIIKALNSASTFNEDIAR